MQTQNQKSSFARNFAIIILLIVVVYWIYSISNRYRQNISSVTERDKQLEEYLGNKK
jgi:hypothetical protein